ncbi:MAG: helix-turn-helix transcriptional regulator [Candidatus Thorarchaeota archaeon]
MHKKISRKLIVIIALSTLLVPCSILDCISICEIQKNNSSKMSQDSIYVTTHNIFIDLTEPKNISVIERYTLYNNHTSSIYSTTFYFNESLTILSIEEDNQAISSYNKTSLINSLSIDFLSSLEPNGSKEIKLRYFLNKETQLLENKYHRFYYGYFVSFLTLQEYVTVRLSRKCEIHEDPGSIVPPTNRPDLSPEGFIDIHWIFQNRLPLTYNYIEVIFKPHAKVPIWIFVIGPLLGLACGIGGTIWYMSRKGRKEMKKIGEVFLSDTEKELLKIIIKNNGKISQRNLCTLTCYTKAKVSRNLISLEKQNLITREKWGRNYQVYVTDVGKKVIE